MMRKLLVLSCFMLAGCAATLKATEPLTIPALDPATEAPCVDPGVKSGNAKLEIGRQRVALANCSTKQGNAVRSYNNVRKRFGGVKQ